VDRAAAVEQAKRDAKAILAGEAEPFVTAQRMEGYLCQHQWLDRDYEPRSLIRFVEGWNVSGDGTSAEIRESARRVVAGE
jgi:hypothetical protein